MPSVTTTLVEMSSAYTKGDPKTWETIQANGDGAIIGCNYQKTVSVDEWHMGVK